MIPGAETAPVAWLYAGAAFGALLGAWLIWWCNRHQD